MNLFVKLKKTHRENKLRVTKGEIWARQGDGIKQEIGINIHTPLFVRQKTSNTLQYHTQNSTKHSVIAYMKK